MVIKRNTEWRGKRIVDIVISLMAIVALLPVFLIISLSICLTMGAPVLFKQQRPGRNSKLFWLLKFRSMTNLPSGAKILLSEDAARLTRLGNFLRKTSLDEIPSLLNVLRGEMSLVGPRPLLVEYLPFYTLRQSRRHILRPGLTGLAQVKGRTSLSWEKRFRYDVWYVENNSVCLDLKILADTVKVVVCQTGNSQELSEIMAPFSGVTASSHSQEEDSGG